MQLMKPIWVAQEGQPIFSIDVHPDGSRFATGGQGVDSGRIVIWNMAPIIKSENKENVPKLLCQMDHHLACVNCVRWSNSGTILASCGDDKLVMLWKKSGYGGGTIFGGGGKVNVESWRCCNTLRGHDGDILDLAWSPGDTLLATASIDNTIIIWNAQNPPEIIKTLKGHTGLVKGVVFDPVGKYLASQSDDKTLRVWRTSDWSQESCVRDPFKESGATTHILRPDWSPDGSFFVSAHAMNGGGPTAQIIERDGWKCQRDFVGHRKAVTCARFCSRIMEKTNRRTGRTDNFVACALGSRDRSLSIWCTNLKRPFFIVSDVFDQSVLDISWSRSGQIIMACSMDGTVAAVILSQKEIGTPLSDHRTYELMSKAYGKAYGAPINTKSNGTMIIENPEMLKLKEQATPTVNGTVQASKQKIHPKGPTDRQIESKTADGRRRITPIFIPPPSEENGTVSSAEKPGIGFGTGEFGSASTQERSKITVEKRPDIVRPNVSPPKKDEAPKRSESPPANIIAVKRKPTKAVISSSEDEDDSDRTTVDRPVEPPVNVIRVKKAPSTEAKADPKRDERLKEAKCLKPEFIKRKREDDDSPRPTKKRGRPPVSREKSRENGSSPFQTPVISQAPYVPPPSVPTPPAVESTIPVVVTPTAAFAPLPAAIIKKSHLFNFTLDDGKAVQVTVTNRSQSFGASDAVNHLRCKVGDRDEWETLLPYPVCGVTLGANLIILGCDDGSLSVFSPHQGGKRLFPPIMLPSQVSKLSSKERKLAVVTTTAKFFLWDLKGTLPKVILRDESLWPLLRPSTANEHSPRPTVTRLSFTQSEQPIIVTNVGKSFTYSPDLGSWLKLTDTANTVQAVSSYSTASSAGLTLDGLPLNSLECLTPVASKMQNVPADIRSLANLSHCETQCAAAMYLGSATEYKFWLLGIVRHASEDGNEDKLRKLFNQLLGPVHSGTSAWESTILGLDKRALLKEALAIIAANLEMQRLFSEFNDQLNVVSDLDDIDGLFSKKQ